MPVTLRFQSTGAVPGNARPVSMRGRSLTIGRSDENDLVLPDPERQISKRHCAIEDHGGNIVVVDLSSNGTFLNYAKVPIGRTPAPLRDGDILTMGAYELVVQITPGAAPDRLPVIPDDPDLLPGPLPEPERVARPILPPAPAAPPAGRTASILPPPDEDNERDFLDDLLGPEPPKGPPQVRRAALGDDAQLPPMIGDDFGPFGAPEETQPSVAASRSEHQSAMADHFSPPTAQDRIPDEWDTLLDGIASTQPAQPPVAPVVRAPEPVPSPERPSAVDAPVAARAAPPVAGSSAEHAARAYLAALGADSVAVADADLPAVMTRLGRAMRAMIEGIREVLMTRSSIKQEFRIGMTMIAKGGNNPLKFSVSPEQAVEAMVRPTSPGWLDADVAAAQALLDIKAHEVAMLTGMEAALKGVLKRLDPAVLEKTIEHQGGFSSLLKGQKARYWEAYEKIYAEVSDQAENDFHELFAREFARAYREQMEKLK